MLRGISDKSLVQFNFPCWHIPCSIPSSCEQIPRVRSCAPRCVFPRLAALFLGERRGNETRARGGSKAPSRLPLRSFLRARTGVRSRRLRPGPPARIRSGRPERKRGVRSRGIEGDAPSPAPVIRVRPRGCTGRLCPSGQIPAPRVAAGLIGGETGRALEGDRKRRPVSHSGHCCAPVAGAVAVVWDRAL